MSTSDSTEQFARRLEVLPVPARKLLCLIVRKAGSGRATMPEVHEACGLDVDGVYALLAILQNSGLVAIEGDYPFETITLADDSLKALIQRCEAAEIPLEEVVVDLHFDLLS